MARKCPTKSRSTSSRTKTPSPRPSPSKRRRKHAQGRTIRSDLVEEWRRQVLENDDGNTQTSWHTPWQADALNTTASRDIGIWATTSVEGDLPDGTAQESPRNVTTQPGSHGLDPLSFLYGKGMGRQIYIQPQVRPSRVVPQHERR